MDDAAYLQEAMRLAALGKGQTSPNPAVGAVIVREGQIVGKGYHTWKGVHHAEVLALQEAGEQARGATAYISLEPCAHTGRTPPCTQSLIDAGIARVVCAMEDPNPLVKGKALPPCGPRE